MLEKSIKDAVMQSVQKTEISSLAKSLEFCKSTELIFSKTFSPLTQIYVVGAKHVIASWLLVAATVYRLSIVNNHTLYIDFMKTIGLIP